MIRIYDNSTEDFARCPSVALDGVVGSGNSAINQSPITGEFIPEDKEISDRIFVGTLNQTGFLEVKVTHTADQTTVAKIIHLVEVVQGSRAPSQQWVDKFVEVYTPIIKNRCSKLVMVI